MAPSDRSALAGQVVVVTGAGSGIGRASAHLLAAEGARLVLVGRRAALLDVVAEEIAAEGGTALAVPAAVDDPRQVDDLLRRVRHEFGPVDILVNNAGSASPVFNVLWTEDDDWQQVVDVNLTSVFRLSRAVLPEMLERGRGTIITVSSIAARKPSLFSGPAYAAAKAGVHNFMSYLNETFGDEGIRATTILPGEVDTAILDLRPVAPPAEHRRLMVQPEDVARAVHLAATLPQRTVVPELVIIPSVHRDRSAELLGNREAGRPVPD